MSSLRDGLQRDNSVTQQSRLGYAASDATNPKERVRVTRGPLKGFVGTVIASENGKWFRVQFGGNFAEWMHRSECEAA